jgi:DNA-binding NarL/FixJ family response regulator
LILSRVVILLAIADQHVRATYAYALSAAGFDVVMPDATRAHFSTQRPDIVVIDLMAACDDADPRALTSLYELRGHVPIVALASDLGSASCDRARHAGCAAVCLATCPANVLAAGLRAVIERT